ncbi:DUF4286 family protein [Paraburkholderia lycopersici]|uniref:EthD domain-containing protein n=1 Tax=Paraburkholderia lycopersici TaxID=416944 RepID=A0A1G6W6N4_9BURK|nr:DUF4286 family protein [Paraburkholderia lycopersici]SDD60857.1 hypothetical protein SAMN05421548_12264 [Paraburkholderia lycopersici]
MFGKTILFSEMIPDSAWEADFNEWYDTEHIPVRMRAPGFVGAQRYHGVDSPAYLAVYEMESPAALATPEYKEIKGSPSDRTRKMLNGVTGFTRYIGVESGHWDAPAGAVNDAPVLYAVFFEVPPQHADEFDRWYVEDHIPTLMKCEDWLKVRRFEIVDGEPGKYTHLALHYLASTAALSSPERDEARRSPWRARLAAQDWFKGHYVVFEKHGQRFKAAL